MEGRMNAVTRRIYDMCVRVVNWASAHPDDEPGFGVLLAQLQALAVRLGDVITAQRNGLIDSRASRSRKQELRREMLAVPIAHLAQIGTLAAPEVHELDKTFRFRPSATTLVAFQSAARAMLEEAQTHKEVLVKHGLSESVLVELERMVDQFDAAMRLGAEGRMRHTAATRELETLTKEAGRLVRAMDARVRIRFRNDLPALEEWISARAVLGTPRPVEDGAEPPVAGGATPGAAGEVRPAA
jgi:hypothetical protein